MMTNIINKIFKIPNIIDNCMNFYICGNEDIIKNDINILNTNTLNTNIIDNNIPKINIHHNINIMVTLINIRNTRPHKLSNTRKSIYNDNLSDELYTCNYCKKKCTLDIHRFMDNSYCSKFCRNHIIPPNNTTK